MKSAFCERWKSGWDHNGRLVLATGGHIREHHSKLHHELKQQWPQLSRVAPPNIRHVVEGEAAVSKVLKLVLVLRNKTPHQVAEP